MKNKTGNATMIGSNSMSITMCDKNYLMNSTNLDFKIFVMELIQIS